MRIKCQLKTVLALEIITLVMIKSFFGNAFRKDINYKHLWQPFNKNRSGPYYVMQSKKCGYLYKTIMGNCDGQLVMIDWKSLSDTSLWTKTMSYNGSSTIAMDMTLVIQNAMAKKKCNSDGQLVMIDWKSPSDISFQQRQECFVPCHIMTTVE